MTRRETISQQRAFVMGIAMIVILLYHQPFIQTTAIKPFKVFGYWGVDLFFFISGMGIYTSLSRNTIGVYFKNRVSRILPAYLIGGSIIGLSYSILDHLPFSIYFTHHLWFINAIAIFYVISPFLKTSIDKWGGKVIAPVVGVCLLICTMVCFKDVVEYPIVRHFSPFYPIIATARLPVFILGMVFARNASLWNSTVVRWCSLFLLPAIALAIIPISGLNDQELFPDLGSVCLFLQFLLLMPAIPAIFQILGGLGEWVSGKPGPTHRCISFFGVYSLEIYIWHPFIDLANKT